MPWSRKNVLMNHAVNYLDRYLDWGGSVGSTKAICRTVFSTKVEVRKSTNYEFQKMQSHFLKKKKSSTSTIIKNNNKNTNEINHKKDCSLQVNMS